MFLMMDYKISLRNIVLGLQQKSKVKHSRHNCHFIELSSTQIATHKIYVN